MDRFVSYAKLAFDSSFLPVISSPNHSGGVKASASSSVLNSTSTIFKPS